MRAQGKRYPNNNKAQVPVLSLSPRKGLWEEMRFRDIECDGETRLQ